MSRFSAYSFKNLKVLVRVDFNVPLDKKNGTVLDNTRLIAAVPTIKKIIKDGGCAILMSHLGRPKESFSKELSLCHIVPVLSQLLGEPVLFSSDCVGTPAQDAVNKMRMGEVLLLENLRFHKEEEMGDKAFAQQLATLGDCWVNDAFGTAHRAHASTSVMASFFPIDKRFMGYCMSAEIDNATRVLQHAEKPLTAIIGGAKVSDKILLLEKLLLKADQIIIGGGMAYSFIKALGGNIGSSIYEQDNLAVALGIIEKAKQKNVSIQLPIDSVIADSFSNDAQTKTVSSNNIPDGWMGLDIGDRAIIDFSKTIEAAKTILWNGPLGVFEMSSFQNGTKSIATAVAKATANGCFSLIGGGDSVSAVQKFGLSNQMSYLSTGGGALLEYFEGKTLPGILAVTDV